MEITSEAKLNLLACMENYRTVHEEVNALAEVFDERNVVILDKAFLFGRHLVHPRMIDIFTKMLKIEKDNDLNTIIISEVGPIGKFGEYLPELKAMVISMPRLLSSMIETIDAGVTDLSISAALWTNMIYTFCHELYHNISCGQADNLDDLDEEAEDEMAHKYAMDMLEEIQRTMDAEPAPLAELPWFNTRMMEHLVMKINAGNDNWTKQKIMMDAGLVFQGQIGDYTSLREYYKATSKDTIWENEGAELELKTDVVVSEDIKPKEEEVQMSQEVKDPFETNFPELAAKADAEAAKVEPTTPSETGLSMEEMEDLEMQAELAERIKETDMEDRTGSFIDIPVIPTTQKTEPVKAESVEPTTDMQIACRRMWMKLYNHMFTKCGWAGGKFTRAFDGMIEPVDLRDNPTALNLIESFVGLSPNFQRVVIDTENTVGTELEGKITGATFVNGTVPVFDITLNLGGVRRKFRLIAQNPAKGSTYGQRAKQGDRIAWLIDQNNEEWVALIDNGVYHVRVNGKWTPVNL